MDSKTFYKYFHLNRNINFLNYQSSNEYRHKNSDSLYAHYSMVDDYNYDVFPSLGFTNPVRFTLKEGQALYIPKNWWHWVKTTEKTFAVNYWFKNKLNQDPFIFDHHINCDMSLLDDEIVYIWNSKKITDNLFETNFKQFYNSGIDDNYLITLSNYPNGKNNSHIKDKLSDYIKFPNNEKLVREDIYTYNVWISSNKHDTGLHYDDEDGILCVLEGEKDIILFPPSDTQHLYPYEVSYEWKETRALNFRYNTFSNLGYIDGVSSGELLYVTCNNDIRVLSVISKLHSKRTDSLVWGFKKYNDQYRWEVYNYTLNNNPKITSWDVYGNSYDISDEEHYYFKIDDNTPIGLPFWGYGKYKKNSYIYDEIYDESKIFVVDSYESFYENYDEYMDRLEYKDIKTEFKKIILEKYLSCYELCIFNKKPGEIFIMYMGLTNQEFINFLVVNEYPEYIIDFVTNQVRLGKYHINNEIAIVYDIETQTPIRSAFYGNM